MTDLEKQDQVSVNDVFVLLKVGETAWRTKDLQQIILSTSLQVDLSIFSTVDSLEYSPIDYRGVYSILCQPILDMNEHIDNILIILSRIACQLVETFPVSRGTLTAKIPKAIKRVEAVMNCSFNRTPQTDTTRMKDKNAIDFLHLDQISFHQVQIAVIIGILDIERVTKQIIHVDLIIENIDLKNSTFDWSKLWLFDKIFEFIESTSYKTLEALTHAVVNKFNTEFPFGKVTAILSKPSVFSQSAKGPSVSITRTFSSIKPQK